LGLAFPSFFGTNGIVKTSGCNSLEIFKMAGVKGRSGTNKGKDRPWTEALRLVAFRDDEEGKRRLLKIAERCVKAAEEGDMQAIREIGDRLDGKPAQAIDVAGTLDIKPVSRMSDDDLEAIAAGRSNGATAASEGARKLN